MRVHARRVVVGILLLIAVGLAAARPFLHWRAERELIQFAPALDRELAHHLTFDGDSSWVAFCARSGAGALGVAAQQLGDAMRVPDYALFLERRVPVEAALLRVATGFRIAFGFRAIERHSRRDLSLSSERDFALRAREREYIALSSDSSRPVADRIARADQIAAEFERDGDPYRAIYPAALAATWETERGDRAAHRARLRALVVQLRALEESYMLCQILGELGADYESAGQDDSMRACFDEGIAVAT